MPAIRLIVAGSRTITDYALVASVLDKVKSPIECVIVGGARGVDSLGERWARFMGIPVVVVEAPWATHGKRAGHIRNGWMAERGTHLILIWDGKSKGSANMLETAERKGLMVHQVVVPFPDRKYWVSCSGATCQVNIGADGRITDAAPIWRRFVGQDAKRLWDWLRAKFGEVNVVELKD